MDEQHTDYASLITSLTKTSKKLLEYEGAMDLDEKKFGGLCLELQSTLNEVKSLCSTFSGFVETVEQEFKVEVNDVDENHQVNGDSPVISKQAALDFNALDRDIELLSSTDKSHYKNTAPVSNDDGYFSELDQMLRGLRPGNDVNHHEKDVGTSVRYN